MDERSAPLQGKGQKSASSDKALQQLIDAGLLLANERELSSIAEVTLSTALALSGATSGAFLYNRQSEDGESFVSRLLTGLAPEMEKFPAPNSLTPFESEDSSLAHTLHFGDLSRDQPAITDFAGVPFSNIPVQSYIAFAVRSPQKELLGSLILGHEDRDALPQNSSELLLTLAAQCAAAIQNSRLAEGLSREVALADATRAMQVDAENERAQTAQRLRQALDAGQLGTWTWNKDTDMLDLDERAAEILQAEPHVLLSRTALRSKIVIPEDLSASPEDLNERLQTGEAYRSEYRIAAPEGQRWVSSRGLPTLAQDGQTVTGLTGTVQDITAQKTQEAALRQSEKLAATGRMAATIAHEINNPLEAVTNLIYLSKTDPSVPGEVRHLLELADTELARVSQIAQQTLGFYRDTSHPTDIDLTVLLHGVADLFSRKLQSRNLSIHLDVHDDLHIFGLQGEVRQVFSNLIVNAIDASSRGKIRVRARPASHSGVDGVKVMICDEGEGIPSSIRHKLFAPFFTTKNSTGTGLGLWVTRGIIEKTGGRVAFRSRTDPPTGTVFRVFLPSANEEKNASPPLQTMILQ